MCHIKQEKITKVFLSFLTRCFLLVINLKNMSLHQYSCKYLVIIIDAQRDSLTSSNLTGHDSHVYKSLNNKKNENIAVIIIKSY